MNRSHRLRDGLKAACAGSLVAACVLLVVVIPAAAQGPDQHVLYEEDFEAGLPRGWELEPGWDVLEAAGNHVLAGEGHRWARPGRDQFYPSEVRIRLQLMLQTGAVHLVFRNNDEGRYFIQFHREGSNLNKQYWPDTFFDGLATQPAAHMPDTWYTVDIVGKEATIEFWVNDQLQWTYTDPEPLLSGAFAFETLDNSLAFIDNITVYGPAPPASAPADLAWERTGGPLGGLGYDIRMRPDNPDILYVTDAWAGVFMSTDGGQTWSPANNGITTRTGESADAIPVFCLTIDPHDYDTIWIGTQNVRGIFKSTDGGQSWERKDNGVIEDFGITFRGITVDPSNPAVVYAAAELSSFAWAGTERMGREFDMTQGVVYRTTNGGESWSPIWRGDNLARYVWIDPRDSNVIYVSTGIFDREAADSDPVAGMPGGVGIVKSTDGGQTWSEVTNGLGNLYVGTLFMHPTNPDILLAGTGNNQYFNAQGVYLSTDGGDTWQRTLRDENINAVEFATSDPAIAYAGSANAIYRSSDGGYTWQQVSGGDDAGWGAPGVRAGFPIDFQVDPRDPDRLFANNYGGGNFLSSDGGRTWVNASQGYTGAQVRDIAVDPVNGAVYAAARSGVFRSDDEGTTWVGLSYPPEATLEWYVVTVDPHQHERVLAGNNWSGRLLESLGQPVEWRPISDPLRHGVAWRAIAFAPSDPQTIYAGSSAFYSAGTFSDDMPARGVFVSRDGGQNWSPANDAQSGDANVTALAVAHDNPQVVFAATGNRGPLKTTDGGRSWQPLTTGLPVHVMALSVATMPQDANIVFAGLFHGGLFRSTDGGATWQNVSMGLNPEATVADIAIDPVDPQTIYVADRFSGVYRSTDGGSTWAPVNDGLRMRSVNALAFSGDGALLYAATEGEGVYRLRVR